MSSYRQLGFLLALSCFLLAGTRLGAQAQSFTTFYSFGAESSTNTNADGANPSAALIQASDGNLYGTCQNGGANGNGTIFKVTLSGAFTTLHTFSALSNNTNADGANPSAALIQASDGNLYGTAPSGGTSGKGTIFKITTSGTFTTLHNFTGGADGANPYAALLQASDGNVYGTSQLGGANGKGTIFKITPSGTFTTLYSFSALSNGTLGTNTDGAVPRAALLQASDGNLYGTASAGGANGAGTIFKITPSGTFTTLYSFNAVPDTYPYTNAGGGKPWDALIQASDGNLYGTCRFGGAWGNGTIFQITPSGTFTTLYSFSDLDSANPPSNPDGAYPRASLVQASDGNLYGTALNGGIHGWGTIFRITLSGAFTTLYSFSINTDSADPFAALIQASDGNLYGAAFYGGANGSGTIFAFDISTFTIPTLSSLSPGSINAGGPAFTLTVKGTDFSNSDSVHWKQGTSTIALSTSYVSATQLKASVPASLIASPGKATITVVTSSGVASNSKTFTIKQTTLKLTTATLTKTSTGTYTAILTLKNIGYLSASNVKISKASLGLATTSTSLPVSLGTLAAGASTSAAMSFPGSAGSSGTIVTLKVSGTFTGGTFSGSLKVTLP